MFLTFTPMLLEILVRLLLSCKSCLPAWLDWYVLKCKPHKLLIDAFIITTLPCLELNYVSHTSPIYHGRSQECNVGSVAHDQGSPVNQFAMHNTAGTWGIEPHVGTSQHPSSMPLFYQNNRPTCLHVSTLWTSMFVFSWSDIGKSMNSICVVCEQLGIFK